MISPLKCEQCVHLSAELQNSVVLGRDEGDGLADIEPHNFVHTADEDVTKHVVALHR